LKLFNRNVFRLQTIEQFVWGDAAFLQTTLTTCLLLWPIVQTLMG